MAREFAYEPQHFEVIARLAYELAGITLAAHKQDMVYSRLARRVRELGLTSFEEYCAVLLDPAEDDERGRLINALTTNLTRFFREPHHFEHFETVVLPDLVAQAAAAPGSKPRLRIWSAGCSTGEEPYTIAMVLLSAIPDLARWDARILATDIDTKVLATATAGIYDGESASGIPAAYRQRFTRPTNDGKIAMGPALRQLIAFKGLNLIEPWPMRGSFDVVFCRNVMIYFDREGRAQLVDRFADQLKPDGWLYLGHSESLIGLTDRFVPAGTTTHRKVS